VRGENLEEEAVGEEREWEKGEKEAVRESV